MTNKIKKDVEKILKSVTLLESEHSNFHNTDNKKDFDLHINRVKLFLTGTKMIVDRDKELKIMEEATKVIDR